jgi:hypothetical protein
MSHRINTIYGINSRSAQEEEKQLYWVGSSKKDLLALPVAVKSFFGHALHLAQHGERHAAAKVLRGFAGAGHPLAPEGSGNNDQGVA